MIEDYPELLAWIKSNPRKPPHLAFTAGLDREIADLIDAATADLRKQRDGARFDTQAAYQQLVYLWNQTGSCPCGARRESPNTHSHVTDCPTARAIKADKEFLSRFEKRTQRGTAAGGT